jgi:hypothetical protein
MNQQTTKTATATTFAFNAAAALVCDRDLRYGIRLHAGKPLSELHRSKLMETGRLPSERESMPGGRRSPLSVSRVKPVTPPVEGELPAPVWAALVVGSAMVAGRQPSRVVTL